MPFLKITQLCCPNPLYVMHVVIVSVWKFLSPDWDPLPTNGSVSFHTATLSMGYMFRVTSSSTFYCNQSHITTETGSKKCYCKAEGEKYVIASKGACHLNKSYLSDKTKKMCFSNPTCIINHHLQNLCSKVLAIFTWGRHFTAFKRSPQDVVNLRWTFKPDGYNEI